MERKKIGEGIGTGSAVILVKDMTFGDQKHPFWEWLREEGFQSWGHHGNFGCGWVFINLNSMIYAPGMPGIRIASAIREHAITVEEFKIIWNIFSKYEGLPVLEMPKKTGMKLAQNKVQPEVLNEWLKNPYWAAYYRNAPSARCRKFIALEFWYSENEDEEAGEAMDRMEEEMTVDDLRYLIKFCGNNPRRGVLERKIREKEMSPDR